MASNNSYTGLEVAVTGMASRFPGAATPVQFWNNLSQGKESVTFYTDKELAALGVSPQKIKDPGYVKAAVNLEGKEYFDAAFFDYRPAEATIMDPQIRIFHECLWEAFEDAGYIPDNIKEPVSLHISGADVTSWRVYSQLLNEREQLVDGFSASLLNNVSFLPTLLAYKFNLRGPAVFLFSACSSSLMGVHQACRSLLTGESKLAVAGGVKVKTSGLPGYKYQPGLIYSSDGHCKTFDATSNGTLGGEGAGAVILKKLKDALADGDHIYAVIKGSAMNNDGNRKVGFTAPSVQGQAECIRTALKLSRVEPDTITYIEAHGTGTRLGDPVEIAALTQAFNSSKKQYCAIGAVKTNFGHLDAAAGIAGFIKTVLSVKNRQLPPSLHFNTPNPEIEFAGSPFFVNTALRTWDAPVLRAGVSSFGIGGTNVHVILEEAPEVTEMPARSVTQVFPFSARTDLSLQKYISAFQSYLTTAHNVAVSDMAHTLQYGRKAFRHRAFATGKDAAGLQKTLTALPVEQRKYVSDAAPRTVFLFPGTGTQYPEMAAGLYAVYPCFSALVDEGLLYLQELTGIDHRPILFPLHEVKNGIHATEVAMPLLFIVEYALAALLMDLGVTPSSMLGHSLGEYTAAAVAGVFSFRDGIILVLKRAQLIAGAGEGAMLSVQANEVQIQPFLAANEVSLAAVNTPDQCVLSGRPAAISATRKALMAAGIAAVPLTVESAFHSACMDNILEDFRQVVANIPMQTPVIPFISNITGTTAVASAVTTPDYWVEHLRNTVRFSAAVNTLLQTENTLFVEVGPRRVLTDLVQAHTTGTGLTLITTLRRPNDKTNDDDHLKYALGMLWINAVEIRWDRLQASLPQPRRTPLPTYCFEQQPFPVMVNTDKLYNRSLSVEDIPPSAFAYPYLRSRKLLPVDTGTRELVLVFNDAAGISEQLITRLQEQQQEVWAIPAADRELPDITALDRIAGNYEMVKFVYCWQPDTAEEQAAYLLRILHVLRSYKQQLPGIRFYNIYTADEKQEWSAANLLKVISSQFSDLSLTSIDISACNGDVTGKVLQELQFNTKDNVVILNNNRWVQEMESIQLETNLEKRWQRKGTYLVNGLHVPFTAALSAYLAGYNNNVAVSIAAGTITALEEQLLQTGHAAMNFNGVIYIDNIQYDLAATDYPEKTLNSAFSLNRETFRAYRALFDHPDFEFGWIATGNPALADQLQEELSDSRWTVVVFSPSDIRKILDSGDHLLLEKGICDIFKRTAGQTTLQHIHYRFLPDIIPAQLQRQPVAGQKGNTSQPAYQRKQFDRAALHTPLIMAATPTEEQLLAIWEDFFGCTNIGVEDPFLNIGGDSLKSMVMINRIRAAFSVEITLEEFFSGSTVRGLSEKIDNLSWIRSEPADSNKATSTLII